MSERKELPTVGGPSGETCETCYFWDQWRIANESAQELKTPQAKGECRRHSPVVAVLCLKPADDDGYWDAGDIEQNTVYPIAMRSGWCGDWKAK